MIQFGTDGWRALIDQEFTPENIKKVIQAFCDVKKNEPVKKVILGYDRRLKSRESAELVASVLAANGFQVELSSQYCPTPCISWMVKNSDAFVGVMVTASHNPWQWNGIKFKESYGGSASPEYTGEIEKQLLANEKEGRAILEIPFSQALASKKVTEFDPNQAYLNQLLALIDVKAIQRSGYKILYDAMYGAGSHFLSKVLGDSVVEIHNAADPKFGGTNPEPIDKNLSDLIKRVPAEGFQVGLATDGDADRIGAVDEHGRFVSSHLIFALLLQHYVEDRGLKGTVVKSISTTQMINRLCEEYGIPLTETAVGFKHISSHLVKSNALMGGEESGGISFRDHVHERDGLLNGLMLLQMMAVRKKTLSQLIEDLFKKTGTFAYNRLDLHVERAQIDKYTKALSQKKPTEIAGLLVKSCLTVDGFKFFFEDGSWLLIRSSGTEPLVRVYSEAKTDTQVAALLEAGKKLVLS